MTGVIPKTTMPAGLRELAALQAGVLSREQVHGYGLSDRVIERLVAEGTWRRVSRGVYATSEDSWLQRAWAGVLLGGTPAVLGEEAAGHLQGLVREPPDQIAVFVGRGGRVDRDDRWRFVRSDRLGLGEPPRTRLPQTVVDLARSLNPDGVTALLAEAIGSHGARPEDILRVVNGTSRLPNRALVTEILGDVVAGIDSPLERRYLRSVERPHGLPAAERRVRPAARYLCDAWYREYGVLVELDGDIHHRGLARLADMDRDNLHAFSGLFTLRFTWAHVVGDPCGVARQVAVALAMHGWSGELQTCPRCNAEGCAL